MMIKPFLITLILLCYCCAYGQNLRYIRELENQLDTPPSALQWKILSELSMEVVKLDSALAWRYYESGFGDLRAEVTEKEFTALLTKGFLYRHLNQPDSAVRYYTEALAIAESLNNAKLQASGLQKLAEVNMRIGNTLLCIEQFKQGINLAKDVPDSVIWFGLVSNLAYAYHTLSSYDSASMLYLKGAEYCENQPLYACAQLYNNMGITYQEQGELDRAEVYHYQSLDIRAQAYDSLGIAGSFLNIAGLHWFRSQIDSATFYVNKAYEIFLARGDTRGQSQCLSNLGVVYNYQGKYDEAIEAYERSILLHKQSLDEESLAIAYVNMAEPQLALKRYETTFAFLDTAITIAGKVGSKMLLGESYLLSAKVHEEMGDIRQAWDMSELYHSYKDSIAAEATDKQVAELETKFETEAKERKINEQDLLLAQQSLTLQQNNWIMASIIVISLFLLIMVMLQRNRQKLKAEQRMAEERKRLIEEQIDAVVSSLEKERRRFSEDLHDGFGQYISLIKQKVDLLNHLTSRERKEAIYEESEKLLKEMGGELKNICFNLMPKTLIQHGLAAALQEYLLKINSGEKIATEYIAHDMEGIRLEEVLEINLYRVCQEWTNNIMKHADAKKISVQLVKHDDLINLTIEDDGKGFDQQDFEQSTGNGWKNIMSRVNLMKGEILVDTQPGIIGTTFILDVPVRIGSTNVTKAEITHA